MAKKKPKKKGNKAETTSLITLAINLIVAIINLIIALSKWGE